MPLWSPRKPLVSRLRRSGRGPAEMREPPERDPATHVAVVRAGGELGVWPTCPAFPAAFADEDGRNAE